MAAAFVLVAIASSSASALPEWGKCEAKAGGKFIDSNCTKKASLKTPGSFEYLKASQVGEKRVKEGKSKNVPFSGESVGGGGLLTTGLRDCKTSKTPETLRSTRKHCEEEGGVEASGGEEKLFVECAKESNTGEAVASNKVASVKVLFTGCLALGSFPCHAPGKAEGEIETSVLKGQLGYIKKAGKEVGVLLEPVKKHGTFAEFICLEELEFKVGQGNSTQGAEYTSTGCFGVCPGTTPEQEKNGGYDGIISPITPVNQETSTFEQKYAQEPAYPFKNIPSNFEGKHLEVLEDTIHNTTGDFDTDWMDAGEVISNVNTPEEEGMIKA